MDKKIIIGILIVALVIVGIIIFCSTQRSKPELLKIKEIDSMRLTSIAFENNQNIPVRYTCDGKNISPPLQISEVSNQAKSLVLIVDDPDSPSGSFTHWVLWNIDPSVSIIEEGKIPEGSLQGVNDFRERSYGGPCPTTGMHHYHFRLYALSEKVNIDSHSTKEDVENEISSFVFDKAELIGLYQREREKN